MLGLSQKKGILLVLILVCVVSVLVFGIISEHWTLHVVPRYISHITNKIFIMTNSNGDFAMPKISGRSRVKDRVNYGNKATHAYFTRDPSTIKPNAQPGNYDASIKGPTKWYAPAINTDIVDRPKQIWIDPYINMTSPAHTRFFIVNPQPVYAIGDRIKVRIETGTNANRPKVTGGDIFRAKLFSNEELAAESTDGDVVDLGNGCYEAVFTLRFPGRCIVQVVMIHPAEALQVLQEISMTFPAKMMYIGKFVRGLASEIRKCNMIPQEFGPMCNFSNPFSGVPWYCQPPIRSDLSCADWRWSQSDEPATHQLIRAILKSYDDGFAIKRYREQIVNGNGVVHVQAPAGQDTGAGMNMDEFEFPWQNLHLPPCRPGQHIGKTSPSGYFYHDTWYSTHCHIRRRWVLPNITECLRNTSVHILGDSSGRQIYTMFADILKDHITSARTQFSYESEKRSGPLWSNDDTTRFRLRFNFHGFPIGGSNWFNQSTIRDITSRIDDIMANHDDVRPVVILAIGAHFTYHDAPFFEARLRVIKNALDRLLDRVPNALVIVKSMTAREHNTVAHIAINSEWWMKQLDKILRAELGSDPRIALLDAWDITQAMLYPHNVHPHQKVISNYISHILSFVCPDGI